MPQPNDLSRSLVAFKHDATVVAVIELSQSSWLVGGIVPGIERHPEKKLPPDEETLLRLLYRWRDEAIKAGRKITRMTVAFEAGRDGLWLARWLRARGIEAHVIHPTSIPVSREHRRAKTDRLDIGLLKRAFLGWLRGERDHCSMAAIPTFEEEDAKRPNRERENLVGVRTRIINRLKGAFIRLGIRGFNPKLRKAPERLAALRTPEGQAIPPNTLAELQRDLARLRFITDQIKEIEEARLERLQRAPQERSHAMVQLLARIRNPLAKPARSTGRRSLRRSHRLTGRERPQAAGEGTRQSRQRPRPPRHDPTRLAVLDVPEGKRARPMVQDAD